MDNAFVVALKLPAGFLLKGLLFVVFFSAVSLRQNCVSMPKIRRRRQRKDYRVADAAKKNPENETEEIVVTEDVEEMDDLDDDDMDNAEPPANATNDTASDSLTEDKIEAGIDS